MKKQTFFIKPTKETILSELDKFKQVLSNSVDKNIFKINEDYSKYDFSSLKKNITKKVDNLLKDFNKIHICTKFNHDQSMFIHHNWKFFSNKKELLSFIKNNIILDSNNNEISFKEFCKRNNLNSKLEYTIEEENNAYKIFYNNYDFNIMNNTYNNISKDITIEEFYNEEFKTKFPHISFDFYLEGLRFLN
jgi:hypothetical protein